MLSRAVSGEVLPFGPLGAPEGGVHKFIANYAARASLAGRYPGIGARRLTEMKFLQRILPPSRRSSEFGLVLGLLAIAALVGSFGYVRRVAPINPYGTIDSNPALTLYAFVIDTGDGGDPDWNGRLVRLTAVSSTGVTAVTAVSGEPGTVVLDVDRLEFLSWATLRPNARVFAAPTSPLLNSTVSSGDRVAVRAVTSKWIQVALLKEPSVSGWVLPSALAPITEVPEINPSIFYTAPQKRADQLKVDLSQVKSVSVQGGRGEFVLVALDDVLGWVRGSSVSWGSEGK